jgi:hypothetical protein
MSFVIIILHSIIILAIALWFSRKFPDNKFIFWCAFGLKMLCGFGVGWLYMSYYREGDTMAFYHDATILADLFKEDAFIYLSTLFTGSISLLTGDLILLDPRSLFFVRLISPLAIISGNNYWIMASYCSLLSFCAAWYLYKVVATFFPLLRFSAAVALLFFPSVIFWSSGLIKESIACASLFLITSIFIKFWSEKKLKLTEVVVMLVSAYLLWNLKYYYAVVLLSVGISLVVFRIYLQPRVGKVWKQVIVWIVLFAVLLAAISQLHPNFHPALFIEVVVSNYNVYQEYSQAGGSIKFYSFDSNIWSVLRNTPVATFSALFRPFVTEVTGPMQLAAAIENLLLLLLSATAIVAVVRKGRTGDHTVLVVGVAMYVFLLADFLALSAPNFGTLSRYRIGFLPFFIILIMAGNPLVRTLERRFADLAR